MNHPIGATLFLLAVLVNFVLIAGGLVVGLAVSMRRGLRAFQERTAALAQIQAAYHHPNAIRTPLFEKVFMAVVIALVLAGLPIALAAIFHFGLPFLGSGWTR
jgi:hypothetical protein